MELIWPTGRFEPWTAGWEARSLLLCYATLEKILTEQSQQDFISSLSSNYCKSPFTDLKKNWRFSRNFWNFFGWVATNKFHFVGKFPFIASCPHASVTPAVVSIVNKLCHAGIVVFGPQMSKLAIFLISGQAKSKVYRIRLDTPACFSKSEYLLGDHKPSKNVIRHMQCLTNPKKSGGVVMSSRHLRCKPGSFTFSGVPNLWQKIWRFIKIRPRKIIMWF